MKQDKLSGTVVGIAALRNSGGFEIAITRRTRTALVWQACDIGAAVEAVILATPDIAVVIVESFAEVHLLAALAIARIPVAILLTGQLPEFNRTKAVAAAELAQRASLLARSICERSLIVLRATLNARRDPKWATLLCSAAADAFGVAQWPWFAQRPSS